MKCSLLVFLFTSFVINACSGQLNGDPAPGRSPGPPAVSKPTSTKLLSDYTTITATTSHIHSKYTPQSNSSIHIITDDRRNESIFSESPPPLSPQNDPFIHTIKSHGNSATTHYKQIDKVGKPSSKTGITFVHRLENVRKTKIRTKPPSNVNVDGQLVTINDILIFWNLPFFPHHHHHYQ